MIYQKPLGIAPWPFVLVAGKLTCTFRSGHNKRFEKYGMLGESTGQGHPSSLSFAWLWKRTQEHFVGKKLKREKAKCCDEIIPCIAVFYCSLLMWLAHICRINLWRHRRELLRLELQCRHTHRILQKAGRPIGFTKRK